jgi:hypothetical protein
MAAGATRELWDVSDLLGLLEAAESKSGIAEQGWI